MRFRSRHARETIERGLKTYLTTLGWLGPTPPFGATAVTFQEVEPGGKDLPEGNFISIVLEGDGPDEEAELGGGTWETAYDLAVDIYCENSVSLAESLADDVKEYLRANLIPLLDFTADDDGVAVPGGEIEFDLIVKDRPPTSFGNIDFKRHWRVISGVANVRYPGP